MTNWDYGLLKNFCNAEFLGFIKLKNSNLSEKERQIISVKTNVCFGLFINLRVGVCVKKKKVRKVNALKRLHVKQFSLLNFFLKQCFGSIASNDHNLNPA